MKRLLHGLAAAALLLGAGVADAGDRGRDRGDGWKRGGPPAHAQAWRGDDRRWDRKDERRWRDERERGRGEAKQVYREGYRDGYRAAAREQKRWRRGERLSGGRYVVIDDWWTRRLPRPDRGQSWIASDRDALLVDGATGIILDILRR
jgi:Ni/Co efflux regulator RcnB